MPLLKGRGGASRRRFLAIEVVSTVASLAVVTLVVLVGANAHLLCLYSSPLDDWCSRRWLSSSPSFSNQAWASSWSRCLAKVKSLLGGGRLNTTTPTGTISFLEVCSCPSPCLHSPRMPRETLGPPGSGGTKGVALSSPRRCLSHDERGDATLESEASRRCWPQP
jgi:hypothetical protein